MRNLNMGSIENANLLAGLFVGRNELDWTHWCLLNIRVAL